MGFLDNILCKETLEKNALLEKSNQALLREVDELKKKNAEISAHLDQINVYKKSEDEYRTATAKIKQKIEQEQEAFEKQTRDYETSRKEKGEEIVRLKTKIGELSTELSELTNNIRKSNVVIEENNVKINSLNDSISKLTEQSNDINDRIARSKEIEAINIKEEQKLLSAIETYKKQYSHAEQAYNTISESLELLKSSYDNELVFDILEKDCKAGYVSEWAPQLFKRLYRHNKERAKRLYLELWARHPEPEKFVFSVDSLKLTADGKPIEEFFAAIIAERTGQLKENPEPFIRAWESFVNASNN